MKNVAGLEGVVAAETELSLVDGEKGDLVYCGYRAKELAQNYSFEEVAYLLWHGQLPSEKEFVNVQAEFRQLRSLPTYVENLLMSLSDDMDMMSVIRTVISALGTKNFQWPSTFQEAVKLTSAIPVIIAYRYRLLNNLPLLKPDSTLDHVANYLYMLKGEVPSEAHIKALTGYLILTMEHGMNASTFSARVISSTQSDLVSAVTGAIGAMKGPLHGGAPTGVIALLEGIGQKENAEKYLRSKLDNGERLMGFGHRVYKTEDPRAVSLRTITSELSGDDEWFELANDVEHLAIRLLDEYKPGRKLYTNVEFYAAAILRAVEIPKELFTATFTASRVVGWTAHVMEQNRNNRIIRPSSIYTGKMPE
jgi:citrate synthase